MYDLDPTNANLVGNANYLYALCGAYGVQAGSLISGGGSVIPIAPGASLPAPVEFVVDASTSPILAGNNTLYLPTFIGFNMIFSRGGVFQYQINTGSNYYNWNKVTGLFTCYGAAQLTEEFSINAI